MKIIKKTISLEPFIDRNDYSPTYGTLTASTFYVNIYLTKNIEDLGIFTDTYYIPSTIGISQPPDYTILIEKLSASGITFPFMFGKMPISAQTMVNIDTRVTGQTVSAYYQYPNIIVTGTSDSRLQDNQSYINNGQYTLNFDTSTDTYIDFQGNTVNGVNRVTQLIEPISYVFDADKNDINIGTINQKNGLFFQDFTSTIVTNFSYISQGFNMTNISLSAMTKEEYLLGIISQPEVKSDIFIDRGILSVFESHLKLSEITNLDELTKYGKGYFKLIPQ
jgi:hypothetical protein